MPIRSAMKIRAMTTSPSNPAPHGLLFYNDEEDLEAKRAAYREWQQEQYLRSRKAVLDLTSGYGCGVDDVEDSLLERFHPTLYDPAADDADERARERVEGR